MIRIDEVLNKLDAINQRLDAQHKEMEKNKMVLNKRFLPLERNMDAIGRQLGMKSMGHSNMRSLVLPHLKTFRKVSSH